MRDPCGHCWAACRGRPRLVRLGSSGAVQRPVLARAGIQDGCQWASWTTHPSSCWPRDPEGGPDRPAGSDAALCRSGIKLRGRASLAGRLGLGGRLGEKLGSRPAPRLAGRSTSPRRGREYNPKIQQKRNNHVSRQCPGHLPIPGFVSRRATRCCDRVPVLFSRNAIM
jgi:hypothetical protein